MGWPSRATLATGSPRRCNHTFLDDAIVAQMGGKVPDPDFLKSVNLFVEFDAEELDQLRRSLHPARYAAGDVILQEGNANRALHIVRSGRIRVTRRVLDTDVPLCDLVAGQTFG